MDIEEKLANYRQAKLNQEQDTTQECIEKSSKLNFITKIFNREKQTLHGEIKEKHKDNIKQNLLKRRMRLNEQKSNGLLINEIEETKAEPEEFKQKVLMLILKFLLWALLFALFIKLEFGLVYFVCSLLVLIYLNTGVGKKSKISAYSVFNPNVERIDGTLTAEQLQKNLISPF